MRDIRADLIERIDESTRILAKAMNFHNMEISQLKAKHSSVIDGYDLRISQLSSSLAAEDKRQDGALGSKIFSSKDVRTRATEKATHEASTPIFSVADAARRVNALSELIRRSQEKGPGPTVRQRLTDQVNP
jgi:hypothetical protein